MQTLSQVITLAIADIEKYGYDSTERINHWTVRIRQAAIGYTDIALENYLRKSLGVKYNRLVNVTGLAKSHKIPQFTIEIIKPKLRAELDRRIMASAQLIRLNRESAIEKTSQRFSGWATSIPIGGSDAVKVNPVKADIKKSISQLPFIERRVAIDQGHKLIANINDITAIESGAIAAEWHSHWKQAGYDYRKDHKERDKKIYAIRGNWAIHDGLMKVGKNGYTDQITMPSEEVYCQCFYRYIYVLKDLPDDMLTKKAKI
jgi:hypothetical protein